MTRRIVQTTAFLLILTGAAHAAPSAREICQKMIADGRAGGMDQAKCECTYRVADAILDDDVKTLLFEAWYTGKDNMQAVAQLPGQSRIRKQFKTMERSLEPNCG
ncbi:hypothetical protein [Dinoroseobacter sp. S76]|uniref:hypothetical protein n=1 Tax=Dinoroseobacter sp. S76 TaxID=3415124 RepID=UPI003C7DF6A8